MKKPSTTTQPNLFDQADDPIEVVAAAPPDQTARDFATDPRHHVVRVGGATPGKPRHEIVYHPISGKDPGASERLGGMFHVAVFEHMYAPLHLVVGLGNGYCPEPLLV